MKDEGEDEEWRGGDGEHTKADQLLNNTVPKKCAVLEWFEKILLDMRQRRKRNPRK